jgi:hypothetical protein
MASGGKGRRARSGPLPRAADRSPRRSWLRLVSASQSRRIGTACPIIAPGEPGPVGLASRLGMGSQPRVRALVQRREGCRDDQHVLLLQGSAGLAAARRPDAFVAGTFADRKAEPQWPGWRVFELSMLAAKELEEPDSRPLAAIAMRALGNGGRSWFTGTVACSGLDNQGSDPSSPFRSQDSPRRPC